MARDTTNDAPVERKSELVERLESGNKPKADWRIGTEHEKFGFDMATHQPIPYAGPRGIHQLLEGMQHLLGWEPIMDAEAIIGLYDPVHGGAISLEPGGQFELSGAPLETLHQTCREVNAHLVQLRQIAEPLGIGFIGLGMSPKWSLSETPQMPKSRYRIMADYMPKVGTRGLDMMFRTSTVQVNLDFSDEADMAEKMRVSLALQPVATAIFANSPFRDGRPNGLLSERAAIWLDTDRDRTGNLPFAFEPGFGFEAYVDWALDVPMYFVKRGSTYHDATDVTFRQYMNGALRNRLPGVAATMGDWDNHLSTLFPDVRLKQFLEMRGADAGPWRRICALPAFWVGLLYDSDALAAAGDLVAGWSQEERDELRREVPATALATRFRSESVLDIARRATEIARHGLARRARVHGGGYDEREYLAPVEETLARGKSPAEVMLEEYDGRWGGNIDRIFEAYAY